MHKLTQFRLCPFSRSIRLLLAEVGLEAELIDERPWEWRHQLLALNPSGELPVLELMGGPTLCGHYAIAEFLAEEVARRPVRERGLPLLPGTSDDRAEVRRLVDWFHRKLDREVTAELVAGKVYAIQRSGVPRQPDAEVMRAVRANLRYHLSYVEFLAHQRSWLAGDEMSLADLAAVAHLSIADYLSEMPWDDHPTAKAWYVRIKSRRSFRPLLADRVAGIAPPRHYTDLDF